MRHYTLTASLIVLTIALVSWGQKGHKAIASIAEKHLTTNTKTLINSYLKGETMSDASTWADEISNDPQYKKTSSWHYINLPLGLTKEQFTDYVIKQDKDNIYTAILKAEANLKDKTLSLAQKKQALKFLIHLVGDAHQPMHVSRAEDKGGNDVQVRFNGNGTNLHALWDGKLIDHEGFNYIEMAKKYDWANPEQVKKWQADSPMQWLWESYQVSTQIYDEIKPGENIDEASYKKSIAIIHLRIAQAGVRLAGELNRLFKDQQPNLNEKSITPAAVVIPATKIASSPLPKATTVKLADLKNSVGKNVIVTGKVFSLKDIKSMVLVNVGAAHPNQLLTLALKGNAKKLADKINGKTITIQGRVTMFKGKPEMVVNEPDLIKF
ncbi:S1/P1 nuclease [Pedobacter sp. B4-66]|uniref:S1/P1 nuclease n=1 Tax=Pedobacter sp. B4-66 TaxID=2817280 RepID=UPI001BD9E976|nr:S1/P1 nuclease [Pedobacter sp. B4-66]